MFKKGQIVIVYDGDLIGFTTATLEKKYETLEDGKVERWKMKTNEGYELVRIVRDTCEIKKDGSAYISKIVPEELKLFQKNF